MRWRAPLCRGAHILRTLSACIVFPVSAHVQRRAGRPQWPCPTRDSLFVPPNARFRIAEWVATPGWLASGRQTRAQPTCLRVVSGCLARVTSFGEPIPALCHTRQISSRCFARISFGPGRSVLILCATVTSGTSDWAGWSARQPAVTADFSYRQTILARLNPSCPHGRSYFPTAVASALASNPAPRPNSLSHIERTRHHPAFSDVR